MKFSAYMHSCRLHHMFRLSSVWGIRVISIIAGARRRDHITPVLCQLHWLRVWTSPKATDDPFGLPLITCAWCHVRSTALETSFGAVVGPRIWNSLLRGLRTLDIATNILRRCWRHICFDKATALCDILYKRLRNILTYLLTLCSKTGSHQSFGNNFLTSKAQYTPPTRLNCRVDLRRVGGVYAAVASRDPVSNFLRQSHMRCRIVNWVTTADGRVHTADTTRLNSTG